VICHWRWGEGIVTGHRKVKEKLSSNKTFPAVKLLAASGL